MALREGRIYLPDGIIVKAPYVRLFTGPRHTEESKRFQAAVEDEYNETGATTYGAAYNRDRQDWYAPLEQLWRFVAICEMSGRVLVRGTHSRPACTSRATQTPGGSYGEDSEYRFNVEKALASLDNRMAVRRRNQYRERDLSPSKQTPLPELWDGCRRALDEAFCIRKRVRDD